MYFSDYSEIPKLSNVRARQDGERQQPLTEGHEDSLSQHQNGGEDTRCAYMDWVPLIQVRYTPFFCVYRVLCVIGQVHKYTNNMDYVEM